MPVVNQLYPFATGAGSNIQVLADYLAASARMTGFQAGVAPSAVFNRAIRQASFAAAMIGQFTANNSGFDTLDDGDVDAFEDHFAHAISQMIIAAGTINLAYGVDTSVSANTLTVSTTPTFTSLSDGLIVEVTPANTTTITTPVINVNSIGNRNIVHVDGTALVPGEIVSDCKILLSWDSNYGKFVLLGVSKKYIDDLVAAASVDLSGYLLKSGGTMTGALQLAGNPAAALHAAPKQYIDAIGTYNARTFSGTANALTAVCSPTAPSALVSGDITIGTISATNTSTTVTMALDAGSAKTVKLGDGSTAPAIGDLIAGHLVMFKYDGTNQRAIYDLTDGKVIGGAAVAAGLRVLAAMPPCLYNSGVPVGSYNIASVGAGSATFTTALANATYSVVMVPYVNGTGNAMESSSAFIFTRSTTGLTFSRTQGCADNGSAGIASTSPFATPGFIIFG